MSASCGAIVLQDAVCENIQKKKKNNRSKYLIDPHKIDIFIILPSQSRTVRHKIAL